MNGLCGASDWRFFMPKSGKFIFTNLLTVMHAGFKSTSMLAKITSEMLAAVGAANVAEFPDKFAAFAKTAQENQTFMAESKVTLESLQQSITALEGKILTDARVKEIVGAETTSAISTWAGSEGGKKIIGAEASRITAEALANVGTQPAKPAPIGAAGNDTPEQKAAALISEGKFEEAYKLDKSLQAEFINGKSYAAFMRASGSGAVRITTKAATERN